jgi:hypothetical protein
VESWWEKVKKDVKVEERKTIHKAMRSKAGKEPAGRSGLEYV